MEGLKHKEPSLVGRVTHYLTLGIETTGQWLERDQCFAIGYCVGTGPGKQEVRERGQFVLRLNKPDGMPWAKYWDKQGWEMRCFNEFWRHHEEVLDRMQTEDANCDTEAEMAAKLDALLQRIEADPHLKKLIVVTDTTMFDTVWLCQRLQKYGYADLMHMRDGTGYREGMELDTLRHGITGHLPKSPGAYNTMRSTCAKWEKPALDAMAPPPTGFRAHCAEDDAVKIYTEFLAILNAKCM